MFKKLFNNLMGNDEEKEQPANTSMNAPQNKQEEEEDDDYEDDEDDYNDVEYDAITMHGTHYSITDFDKEVEKRSEKWIAGEKEEDPNFSQKDIDNVYYNYKREVYIEWNKISGDPTDQIIQWELAKRKAQMGISPTGVVTEDPNDPLLAPVHGLTFRDYNAINVKISQGVEVNAILNAMGIEQAVYDELNVIWPKRMQEDPNFKLATLMGQYFKDDHPKLMHLKAALSDAGIANLEKLKTDRYFYEELCGARQAAYQYGLDGAQWVVDNYGINLGDFQSVAMKWMTEGQENYSTSDVLHYQNYQEEKQKEYEAKFAAEQGGNIADDVEF
jgi:hypothetical protein